MKTINGVIHWLSILVGALSLFYLAQHLANLELAAIFHKAYVWYAGIFHPIVGLLTPVVVWIASCLHVDPPIWWKDAAVVYMAVGGATGRGGRFTMWHLRETEKFWRTQGGVYMDQTDIDHDKHMADWRRQVQKEERLKLWTTPLRVFGWPVFWIVDLTHMGPDISRLHRMLWHRLTKGYIGTSLLEFTKISIGAAIFTALNAFT